MFFLLQKLRLMRLKFSIPNIDKCLKEIDLDTDSADNLIKGDLSVNSDEAKVCA